MTSIYLLEIILGYLNRFSHPQGPSQFSWKKTSVLRRRLVVGQTMPFLPPRTGNGLYVPPIKMVMIWGMFFFVF